MFLPIISFSFMLGLAQYESSLYFVTLCLGIAYALHKGTEEKEEEC